MIKLKNNTLLIGLASLILVVIGLIFIAFGTPKKEVVIEEERFDSVITTTVDSKLDFRIEDRTEVCAQALEEIYRDDITTCYLPCIKSATIFLVYEDGSEITLRDALNKKKVTIEELRETGLKMYCEATSETN